MIFSVSLRFWLSLVPLIPSIIVTIFNLYHLLSSRVLRTALNNHVIILLLCCGLIEELTDCIWYISLYHNGTVVSSTPAFCRFWLFNGPSMCISIYILMAWASIERHILIFHQNWIATKTKRFFLHYFPLAICIIWPVMFYLTMAFIVPCDASFSYNKTLCNRYECIIKYPFISKWDSIVHYISPPFIIVSFSIALLIRVLYHKYRIHRRIDWRNYKKMAVQLLPISALYTVLQLPTMIMYAAYSSGLSRTVGADYYADGLFLSQYVILFTPFVSIMSLPELRTKCRNIILSWKRERTVRVGILSILREGTYQTAAVAVTA